MMDWSIVAPIVAFLAMVIGAYFVGSVLGFGTTILLVTFASQLFELDVLLPITMPLNIALGSYIAWRHREHTQWRALLTYVLPRVALGVPLGMALFRLRSVGYLKLVFGAFVTLLAILQLRATLLKSQSSDKPLGPIAGTFMLILGGLVHGLYATAGPVIVYVLGRRIVDKHQFRSTVSTLFLILAWVLQVDYVASGLVTTYVLKMVALSIPAMALGMWLGERAFGKIDARRFRIGVWLLLLAGGIILTTRALLSW